MDERGEDTTLLGRGRHIIDGLVPVPVFVETMLLTITVFILKTIESWQTLAAAGVAGNFLWRLFRAATYDHLETTIGAAILGIVSGNFVRFIWEVFMLIYDRAKKFAQLREEAQAKGEAIGQAKGEAIGRVEGKAEGAAEQNRKWQGWLARRDAAEKAGLPFDEPPPAPLD